MTLERLIESTARRLVAFRKGIRKTGISPSVSAAEVRVHLDERYGDFARPLGDDTLIDDVVSMLSSWNVHVTHPRYFGLFNPPVVPAGVAADLLVAGFNPQLAAWSHAPAANEIEQHALRYLAGRLGFEARDITATFTTAGAEANQSAVLAALSHAVPEFVETGLPSSATSPAIYVSSESHHSIEKAAMTSGLGRRAIRKVAIDDRLEMSVAALGEAVRSDRERGRLPLMVVATAGSTGGGTIDPLAEIAELCASESVWLHVDAAWGGGACLSPKLLPAIAGIERADSVTWDAHKWLSVPMGAGMFFCRHPEAVRRAFAIATPYMPPDVEDTADPYAWTLQWSRRHIGLKVFMSLASLGSEGYRRAIEHQAAMGDRLREELESRGWHVVNRTPLPVVCFTRPEVEETENGAARLASALEPDFWISPVRLGDRSPVLRACITSFETEAEDVMALADAVTEVAAPNG